MTFLEAEILPQCCLQGQLLRKGRDCGILDGLESSDSTPLLSQSAVLLFHSETPYYMAMRPQVLNWSSPSNVLFNRIELDAPPPPPPPLPNPDPFTLTDEGNTKTSTLNLEP